jgi:hypothetical protein
MPLMPRLNRRTKVISIRLSADEYNQLQSLCVTKGVDSFSELARAAMKMLIHHENGSGQAAPDNAIDVRVSEMDERVSALDRQVARMSSMMGLVQLSETQ